MPNFAQPLSKPQPIGPEHSYWFWNPNKVDITGPPSWFENQLRDFDSELKVTWSPIHEKWLVWMRAPKLRSKLCSGWSLLFPVRYPDGSYMPLDERIFARLYAASVKRWDSGKRYFDAVEREWERDRAHAEASRNDDVKYSAGEYFDFMKIKNYGRGNKFANHFS